MRTVIGDSAELPPGLTGDTTLMAPGARLAEVIAGQLPRLALRQPGAVSIVPGAGDILDGWDESYVHARLVELLDGVAAVVPAHAVELWPFPTDGDEQVRAQCDAAARVTAELRGMRWRG